MPLMSPTRSTKNFDPQHAHRAVFAVLNSPGYTPVIRGPATTAVKFRRSVVQRFPTAFAMVGAFCFMIVVLAGKKGILFRLVLKCGILLERVGLSTLPHFFQSCIYSFFSFSSAGIKANAAELIQWRFPVVARGPSLNI